MPASHTGIEHRDLLSGLWPALEGTGGGTPLVVILDEAQVFPSHARQRARLPQLVLAGRCPRQLRSLGEDLGCPPRPKRVVKQEQHHVVLGEKLRNGG